ncbi:MAG: hypothetical protein NT166_04935 [Candidatus Aminicenantes bacterium]|nr:hypothetical protein [Candidatus Aminicenantes bacterium]
MKRTLFIISILIIFTSILAETLWGMPAFARKYRMSCKTCHEPFPHLKPYGLEFAANGYVIKDQDTPRYFSDTGDDKLSLLKEFPFALRMEGFISYNQTKTKIADFSTPFNIKLLSGGALAKNISYYFYFFLSEGGKIVGLEDAFLMFTNLFRTSLSLTIGQFQVCDPIFKRELRLTFEDYHIYGARGGLSGIDLTYDRGIMLNYKIHKGPDLFFDILNGSGIGEANVFENFDSDKYKNVFGRISQDIGKHFRIGACGYYGKEAPGSAVNTIRMLGGDATVLFPGIEINFQYLERKDDNPYFHAFGPVEVKTSGGFVEVIIMPKGSDGLWYGVGLFNWVNSDQDELDYRSVGVHLGYLLLRNFRLTGEFNYIFKGPEGKYARAILGLVTAF